MISKLDKLGPIADRVKGTISILNFTYKRKTQTITGREFSETFRGSNLEI